MVTGFIKTPKRNKVFLHSFADKLPCAYCGENILETGPEKALVVTWMDQDRNIRKIYPCHCGKCDQMLERSIPKDCFTMTEMMTDFMVPQMRVVKEMTLLQHLAEGTVYDPDAAEAYKYIMVVTAPYIMRRSTANDYQYYLNMTMQYTDDDLEEIFTENREET